MKYLLFSLICFMSCASDYKMLKPVVPDQRCSDIKPARLQTSWYDASLDVAGKHISGLLLMKNMADSSARIVFTNEAGVKFFDFEFGNTGTFKSQYIMERLDKKAVVNTLRKDFELILGMPFRGQPENMLTNGQAVYIAYPWKELTAYAITDTNCGSLQRMETGSRKKRMVSLKMSDNNGQPDSVYLQHHTFNMIIKLVKLNRN